MKNKYLTISIILFFASNLIYAQTNFTNGFNEGYKQGYCQDQGIGCIEPIPPIAPIPKIGENSDNYTDGYNRGFQMGLDKGKSNNNTSSNSTNRTSYKTAKPTFVDDIMYNPYGNINNAIALANSLRESKGRALKFLEDENYQAVADICFAGLRVSPKDNEFMLLLGQAYKLSGDRENAIKWLKKSSRLRPSDKNLKDVIRELENGNLEVQENYENKDNSSENFAEIGYNHQKNKEFSKAIFYYSKYLEKEVDNTDALFMRALAKTELNDNYGAISDYEKIIALEGKVKPKAYKMSTVYNNKAYCLVLLKKYKEALPFVTKALDIDKSEAYIWDTRGEIYYYLGESDKSIKDMDRAISIQKSANSYYIRGLAKLKLEQKSDACSDLSKAGELGESEAYKVISKNCN